MKAANTELRRQKRGQVDAGSHLASPFWVFDSLNYAAIPLLSYRRPCWPLAAPPIFLGEKKLTPNLIREGGDGMVTYAELFQYTLVILNVILIAIALWKK